MARTGKFTCEQVIEALNKTKGVYLAANDLKCSARTIYNYINRHQSVADAWEQINGETTDYAYVSLRSMILAREPWAVQFQLRQKGQKRGYGDKIELKHSGEMDVHIDDALDRLTHLINRQAATGAESGDSGGPDE